MPTETDLPVTGGQSLCPQPLRQSKGADTRVVSALRLSRANRDVPASSLDFKGAVLRRLNLLLARLETVRRPGSAGTSVAI